MYGTAVARVEDEHQPCVFPFVLCLFLSVWISLGIPLLGREKRASMLCEQWVLRTFLSIRHSTYDGDDSGYFDDGATWEARDPVMVRKLTYTTHHRHRTAQCREPTS